MPDLCSTCLSKDRSLKPLESLQRGTTLEWLKASFLPSNSVLCFECEAALLNADKFRRRAHEAQERLGQVPLDPKFAAPLLSLSNLCTTEVCVESCVHSETDDVLERFCKNAEIKVSIKRITENPRITEIPDSKIDVVKAEDMDSYPQVEDQIKNMLDKICEDMKRDYVKLFSIVELPEMETDVTDPDLNPTDPHSNQVDPHSNQVDPPLTQLTKLADVTEPSPDVTDSELNVLEPIIDITDSEFEMMDPMIDTSDPEFNIMEPIVNITEPGVNQAMDQGPDEIMSSNTSRSSIESRYGKTPRQGWPILTLGATMNFPTLNTKDLTVIRRTVPATNLKKGQLQSPVKYPKANAKQSYTGQSEASSSKQQKNLGITNKTYSRHETVSIPISMAPPGVERNLKQPNKSGLETKKTTQETNLDLIGFVSRRSDEPITPSSAPPNNFTTEPRKSNSVSKSYVITAISETDMKRHREIHRQDNAFKNNFSKCDSCVQGFANTVEYKTHMDLMHSEEAGPYVCSICTARFKEEEILSAHYQNHFKVYACSQCNFRHDNEDVIKDHIKDVHELNRCQFCRAQFSTASELSDHVLATHMSDRELRKNKNTDLRGPQYQDCPLCGKSFRQPHKMRLHMECHEEFRQEVCPLCGKHVHCLQTHLKRHEDEEKNGGHCRYCNKYVKYLRYHITRKHERNEKTYCKQCDKQFITAGEYNWHMRNSRVHNPDAPVYECEHCTRSFTNQKAYRQHVDVIHNKLYSYVCDVCGHGTCTRSALKAHIRVKHLGMARKTNKRDHICHLCGSGFSNKTILECHIRTHTGEKSYHCGHCDWKFTQRSTLVTHLRGKHPGVIAPKGQIKS